VMSIHVLRWLEVGKPPTGPRRRATVADTLRLELTRERSFARASERQMGPPESSSLESEG
jgi:hypothetical protein